MLIAVLLRLGFRVKFDNGMEQPRNACGAVASLAAALLSEVDWKQADMSLAAHSNIISNAVSSWLNLGVRAEDECPDLSADHVAALYQFFKIVRTAGTRTRRCYNVDSFSVVAWDGLCEKLWRLVTHSKVTADPWHEVCVCNTDHSGMQGSHWFAVAFSIEPSFCVNTDIFYLFY